MFAISPALARSLVVPAFAAALAGCGGDTGAARTADSLARDTAARTPAPAKPIIAPADPGPGSRADSTVAVAADPSGNGLGLWDAAALEKRLDLQGMAPRKRPEPVRHAFLAVAGTAYQIGNADLQAFFYENNAAAERELSGLDTVTVAPRGQPARWPTKATLIRNNNLVAILLSQNALQIERVQRALMAGLPAPR